VDLKADTKKAYPNKSSGGDNSHAGGHHFD